MPETSLVSSQRLLFCFPLVTHTFSSSGVTCSMQSILHHNCNSYAKDPSSIQRTAVQQSHLILNGRCRLFNNSMANFTNLYRIPGIHSPLQALHVKFCVPRIQSSCQFFPGVLGDCFLIHKSELRHDVVSVKTLCSLSIPNSCFTCASPA